MRWYNPDYNNTWEKREAAGAQHPKKTIIPGKISVHRCTLGEKIIHARRIPSAWRARDRAPAGARERRKLHHLRSIRQRKFSKRKRIKVFNCKKIQIEKLHNLTPARLHYSDLPCDGAQFRPASAVSYEFRERPRFIDYRHEDKKKLMSLLPLNRSWFFCFFRKPRSSPQKNELFSQEMHLKIPLLSRGLKLSNSKPGCRVSALHFLLLKFH
jgi:hypothetical protein